MIVRINHEIDLDELFKSLSQTEKYEFAEIGLRCLENEDLVQELIDREVDWADFGLRED